MPEQPREGLPERIEREIKRILGEEITMLLCRKYDSQLSNELCNEHRCLKPKRIYTNKEGSKILIFCPNLLTTKGDQFYKQYETVIYKGLEAILQQTGDD